MAGKTEYQSSPCAGQGKEIEITSGPSEREMQEANSRADAEKARAATHEAPVQPRPQDQLKVKPIDCAKLNKDRGDAFGRRNATIRESRKTNINRSAAVDRENELI
ncbi:MAG TPA: hypothetical protein VLA81_01270, partial [Burkholderiales bacterium]|nr:hypothetical protein [Burkholderiales bacterium]